MNTWSTSKTKDYLTDYAEVIACMNFDQSDNYTKIFIGNNSWLVSINQILNKNLYQDLCHNPSLNGRFNRERKVTITNEFFLTCSCHYTQRWLMPCKHICFVIESPHLYTEDLFHLRWWTFFEYIYKRGSSSMDEKTRTSA